ncbi:MAG: hypothetical protein O8C63_07510 [Candidatus Methanoperedens sp.]|nr:hypothetical protein [Candidatus Methanoperedens sp.]
MSTERDIIIERLEQKLAARDKEFAEKQESLKESILVEMEKRFTDKIKLRESTLEDIKVKFSEKVKEIIEINKSLRDSLVEERKSESNALKECQNRMDRMEHRLIELNSAYDGVMKELLDQKSIINEIKPRKVFREEPKPKQEIKPKEEEKLLEKPKPKSTYIIADNYVPRERKKQAPVIEAEEKTIVADDRKNDLKKPALKKSEKVVEGVEIVETMKKR